MQTEWFGFLKNLVKEGYYLKNGVVSIFNEIILLNKNIKADDLPVFMDDISKRCMLEEFKFLKEKHSQRTNRNNDSILSTKGKSTSTYISSSKQNIQQIMQNNNLATIYHGTKDMMIDWIKK